jgi:hypothetical protein
MTDIEHSTGDILRCASCEKPKPELLYLPEYGALFCGNCAVRELRTRLDDGALGAVHKAAEEVDAAWDSFRHHPTVENQDRVTAALADLRAALGGG